MSSDCFVVQQQHTRETEPSATHTHIYSRTSAEAAAADAHSIHNFTCTTSYMLLFIFFRCVKFLYFSTLLMGIHYVKNTRSYCYICWRCECSGLLQLRDAHVQYNRTRIYIIYALITDTDTNPNTQTHI